MYTRFQGDIYQPLFSVKRPKHVLSKKMTEGLGYYLRSHFFRTDDPPITINKSYSMDEVVQNVSNKFDTTYMGSGENREDKFNQLKSDIETELKKIDSNFSLKTDSSGEDLTLDYLENMLFLVDEDSTIKEWIETIITAAIDQKLLESSDVSSPFYDGTTTIQNEESAERLSIKVQFLLGEINFYCKTNKLSDKNFGEFFDKEEQATTIAGLITDGLKEGKEIESIVYGYINKHADDLGFSAQLSEQQQSEITKKFSEHFATIQDSPHFDEFLIANPDKKGNIYSHQTKMCCHFLDFFVQQAKRIIGLLG